VERSADGDPGGARCGVGTLIRTLRAIALAGAIVAITSFGAPRAADLPAFPVGPETVPVTSLHGQPHLGANDLARLLDAAKFWRADVRKLVLRSGTHRIVLTVDDPFVLVDDRTLRLNSPVRSLRGELQVPVALLDSLPRDSALARLIYDPRGNDVVVVPPGGLVGSPRVSISEAATRLTFPAERPEDVIVLGRARAHFRVRLGGFFAGLLPDSLPPAGLVRSIRPIASATGCAFEFDVSRDAAGFRVVREGPSRIAIEFARRAGPGVGVFAPEGAAGPRELRVVVLDPGHGGGDPGVTVEGAAEKDLTLALARVLRAELERRLRTRVVLTRESDVAVSFDQRAVIANRAHADLVLSLHFDGFGSPRASGATAYCPPATFGASGGSPGAGGLAPVAVLPWRDVATRHAVESRALAEAVLGALALRDQGPTRLRELLPCSLLGVNAPGIVLECATLSAPADRARVTAPDGIPLLAASIADGVVTWQRNE
jgi:N-acetylmuramoyl-L-alanine amidase